MFRVANTHLLTGTFRKGAQIAGLCFACLLPTLRVACQTPATLSDAVSALHKGDYAKAETELRALSIADPNSVEILDDLGIAFQLQGKTDDAVRTFERVLKIKRLPEAVAILALDFCRDHDFAHAVPLLNEAKAHLGDPNIMATLGPCFLEADQPVEAMLIYQRLVSLKAPPEDENAANLVRSYFDLSQLALKRLFDLPSGRNYFRAIEDAQKDGTDNATDLFPQAYRTAPYLRPDLPIRKLATLLPAHSEDPALLYILSVRAAEKAQELFNRLQQKWPNSLATGDLIAEFKDASGDRDGAIQEYEELLVKHPDAPATTHFALGLLYAERWRWQDALTQFRIASPDGKGGQYVTQRMSECLLHTGDVKSLERLLRDVVSKKDSPFWALRDYGEAEEEQGNAAVALAYLKRASALKPTDGSIHYQLFQLYKKLNQETAASREMALFRHLRTER